MLPITTELNRVYSIERVDLPVVPYAFEQVKRLFESVLARIFSKHEVITTASGNKDDGCDVVEALDPLTTLVSLTAYVKHTLKKNNETK